MSWLIRIVVVRIAALVLAVGVLMSGCDASSSLVSVSHVRRGARALQIVVGAGSVWVLRCDAGCSGDGRGSRGWLERLDARTGRVLWVTRVVDPGAVAVGERAVWVTHPNRGSVSRIDVRTGQMLASIRLVLPRPVIAGDLAFLPYSVAAGAGAVWVSTARGWLARIDPGSNRVVAMIALPLEATGSVVVGLGAVWVAEGVLGLFRVDPVTDRIAKVVIAARHAGRLAVERPVVGGATMWVEGGWATNSRDAGTRFTLTGRDGLAEIGLDARRVLGSVAISAGPTGIAYGGGGAWIASRTRPIVQLFSTRSLQNVQTIRARSLGAMLAVTPGWLWLLDQNAVVTRVPIPS